MAMKTWVKILLIIGGIISFIVLVVLIIGISQLMSCGGSVAGTILRGWK